MMTNDDGDDDDHDEKILKYLVMMSQPPKPYRVDRELHT